MPIHSATDMEGEHRHRRSIGGIMNLRLFFISILLLCFASACHNSSGLEGSVVDGKGQPMAKIKLIAKEIQGVGDKQFETMTDDRGNCRFENLTPSTSYVILPRSDQWKTETKLFATSGRRFRTATLEGAFVIRFTLKDGVISDSRTGLEWLPDSEYRYSWTGASKYVKGLKSYSVPCEWRLPTDRELMGIYYFRALDQQIRIDNLFRLRSPFVWTSETVDYRQSPEDYFRVLSALSMESTPFGGTIEVTVANPAAYLRQLDASGEALQILAKYFDFGSGADKWTKDRDPSRDMRILTVRAPKEGT